MACWLATPLIAPPLALGNNVLKSASENICAKLHVPLSEAAEPEVEPEIEEEEEVEEEEEEEVDGAFVVVGALVVAEEEVADLAEVEAVEVEVADLEAVEVEVADLEAVEGEVEEVEGEVADLAEVEEVEEVGEVEVVTEGGADWEQGVVQSVGHTIWPALQTVPAGVFCGAQNVLPKHCWNWAQQSLG